MSNRSSRRDFLKTSVAAACGAALGGAAAGPAGAASASAPSPLRIKKGVLLGMLPKQLSYADRFKMARDAGFEVVQAYTTSDQHEAEEIKKAAEDAGIKVGDVVVAVDGKNIASAAALGSLVRQYLPGDTVELELDRHGDAVTVRAKLGEFPSS